MPRSSLLFTALLLSACGGPREGGGLFDDDGPLGEDGPFGGLFGGDDDRDGDPAEAEASAWGALFLERRPHPQGQGRWGYGGSLLLHEGCDQDPLIELGAWMTVERVDGDGCRFTLSGGELMPEATGAQLRVVHGTRDTTMDVGAMVRSHRIVFDHTPLVSGEVAHYGMIVPPDLAAAGAGRDRRISFVPGSTQAEPIHADVEPGEGGVEGDFVVPDVAEPLLTLVVPPTAWLADELDGLHVSFPVPLVSFPVAVVPPDDPRAPAAHDGVMLDAFPFGTPVRAELTILTGVIDGGYYAGFGADGVFIDAPPPDGPGTRIEVQGVIDWHPGSEDVHGIDPDQTVVLGQEPLPDPVPLPDASGDLGPKDVGRWVTVTGTAGYTDFSYLHLMEGMRVEIRDLDMEPVPLGTPVTVTGIVHHDTFGYRLMLLDPDDVEL